MAFPTDLDTGWKACIFNGLRFLTAAPHDNFVFRRQTLNRRLNFCSDQNRYRRIVSDFMGFESRPPQGKPTALYDKQPFCSVQYSKCPMYIFLDHCVHTDKQ